jgi:RNA polymerase sigma-19 factor, ECF subfamily
MSSLDLSGNKDAVRALYVEHRSWLVSWLRGKLGCAHSAADLAQDTFIRILGRREALAEVREPRAYLTTIARSLLIDNYRRAAIERAYLDALACLPEQAVPSPEERLLLLETLVRIDAVLDGLNPKARQAFLLSRLEGLPYAEIATQLGVSLSSVEKYMAQAVRHCYLMQSEA